MKNLPIQADDWTLAIDGGTPTRTNPLPYGRQTIDGADIEAVVTTLKSDYLTCGPLVATFEKAFAQWVGAKHAVSVSNGTAALHAAYHALQTAPGDEVLVPAMTFAATANAVLYTGATPVFCDVDPETLLIDAESAKKKMTRKTKGIVAVDYAGQACDFASLRDLAKKQDLWIVEDACHSLGGSYHDKKVGSLADCTVFSFHPVKHMTTGEGGMVTTENPELASRMEQFRNHGITSGHREREKRGTWHYEMQELGYNCRLNDIQCALGLSQMKHLNEWVERRQQIAAIYGSNLLESKLFRPLKTMSGRKHSYHLYVIQIDLKRSSVNRETIYQALRAEGIMVNVHYIPVYLHPYYQKNLMTRSGLCPNAESAYEQILSLPMFPSMTEQDQQDVIHALRKVEHTYLRA